MAAFPLPPVELSEPEPPRPKRRGRKATVAVSVAVLIVAVIAILASRWWPFDQRSIIQKLQEASDSQVQAQNFHRTYLPSPGCVLEKVVFTRGNAEHPLIIIDKLTIRATYTGMLRHHVSQMIADGMKVSIPEVGNGHAFSPKPSNITIDEITTKDAILEFARKSEHAPLRFDIHAISLRNVGWSGPLSYEVKMHNPDPPAEITASGKFGVWNQGDVGKTPVSGEYKLEQADLSIYGGIAGMLSSTGKFSGNLGHIDVSGKTDTPDFEVKSGGHTVDLMTEYTAYVNGTNGDTFLRRVDAYFRNTHIVADGSVAKFENDKGKTARINLSARKGRIEDLLGLFVKKSPPPMSGAVSLQAKAELPPGKAPFLSKLVLQGNFEIGGGEFPDPSTQESVDKLSAGARGEGHSDDDPETVLTDLAGRVALVNGVASFPDITFGVPGAKARLRGTYNLLNQKIDLRGQMKVDTQIANTTTGVKSLLLRVMGPFFKKRKRGGQILPVKIGGTYEKPTFGLDLQDKQAGTVPKPYTNRAGVTRRD